jgi:hypothetical protein
VQLRSCDARHNLCAAHRPTVAEARLEHRALKPEVGEAFADEREIAARAAQPHKALEMLGPGELPFAVHE